MNIWLRHTNGLTEAISKKLWNLFNDVNILRETKLTEEEVSHGNDRCMASSVKLREIVEPIMAAKPPGKDPRSRRLTDPQPILEGVFGCFERVRVSKDLPPRFLHYQTCHRRFQAWMKEGRPKQVLRALAQDLVDRGGIDLSEAYIDGTFVSAKMGALGLVIQSAAKGARSWQLWTALDVAI